MTDQTLSESEFVGIDELEQMAQAEPGNVDIQRRWAWSLLRTNHAQGAKEIFESLSGKAPKDPEIWYALGVVLLRVNDIGGAKDAFKKAASLLSERATESPRLTMLNHMAQTHLKKLT